MEESGKQDEVTSVHGDRKLDICRWDVASGMSRLLEEAVRPYINGTADHHLRQLKCGDDHRYEAWRMEFQRTQRVVSVHQGVNTIVHDDEPAGWGGVLGVWEPWVHQHGDVVVPVQEDQRLLT